MQIGARFGYRPWEIFRCTLFEINLLSKARSEKRMEEHENVLFYLHTLGALIHNAVACVFSKDAKYPPWSSFIGRLMPKGKSKIQVQDKCLAKAMETAKKLGDI